MTGHEAKSIDPAARTVSGVSDQGRSFSFSYDSLLIATGGSPIVPDIPGVDLPGVMALKSLDQGRKMKAYIENHPVNMVLFAIGTTPNSEIAGKASLALGVSRSIAVDRMLRTSNDSIYAAGDCADAFHVVTGKKTWIPLALRANRAGWAVADTIPGKPSELQGICGTAVFKVFDLEVARTGLNEKEAWDSGFHPVSETIKARSRAHSHPGASDIWIQMVADKETGRLLGVQMVGREGVAHRINAAAVALHNQMTVAQFFQTDLAYAPPFGPVWDPLLTVAGQILKKL